MLTQAQLDKFHKLARELNDDYSIYCASDDLYHLQESDSLEVAKVIIDRLDKTIKDARKVITKVNSYIKELPREERSYKKGI